MWQPLWTATAQSVTASIVRSRPIPDGIPYSHRNTSVCRHENTIILASSSPRRRGLIAALGIELRVVPSGADEEIDPGLPPGEQATSLARRKAGSLAADYPSLLALGADTTVAH